MNRSTLPNRRACTTLELSNSIDGGVLVDYIVTFGNAPNHAPSEVFIRHKKINSTLDIAARDTAILLSILMQFGVPLATISPALSRETNGSPQGIAGVVIDKLCEKIQEDKHNG